MQGFARLFAPGCLILSSLVLPGQSLAQEMTAHDQDPAYYEGVDAGYAVYDPWEGFNRNVHAFNDVVDRYALKPVAQVYRAWTPGFLRTGVTNFFSNLEEPINLFNNLLQLKPRESLITTGRFVFNTTFGLAGLIDVSTGFGLPEQEEDFGQTLGYWGLGPGPFVVLPFVGPSTVRDSSRLLIDTQVPSGYTEIGTPEAYYMVGLRAIDLRARLIPAEEALIGRDRYRAIRNAFLQQREFQVRDGKVEDPFAAGEDDMLEDF